MDQKRHSTVQFNTVKVTVSSQRTPLALPPTLLGCDRYSKHPQALQVGAILFFAEVEDLEHFYN